MKEQKGKEQVEAVEEMPLLSAESDEHKKKRFVDRLEQAEGEAARSQRVAESIEQLERIHQAQKP